jgi:L-seryl-tRNA(Ser) seleniumtransferase
MPSLYGRLGVRPVVNAKGTYTYLSGSVMLPETVEAMAEAARAFVDINELEDAAGRRLAELTGAEAAMVTGGCAAALTQTAAACMAGTDPARIKQLPDRTGMRHEIYIQRAHRNQYDQSFRMAGANLVEFDTIEELADLIGPDSCAVAHIAAYEPWGKAKIDAVLKLCGERKLPLLVDAAAELPPAENLTKFVRMGADAVMFSGGKGLRGPQASGLLLGKKWLVEAARLNACPNHSVGRPMKAGKEEIAGLLRAVELYVERDHEADWKRWEYQVDYVAKALASLKHVTTGSVPEHVINHVPRLWIKWDPSVVHLDVDAVLARLIEGEPRVAMLVTDCGLTMSPNNLEPGEEEIVARRLREVLAAG